MLLGGNCWNEPPSEVVQGGWAHIINYYEALERAGATSSHTLKVVLVGAAGAGKTSLTRGLLQGDHAATVESECIRGTDVHIMPWRPNPSQPLEVVMWDFAGHSDHYSTHQVTADMGHCFGRAVGRHRPVLNRFGRLWAAAALAASAIMLICGGTWDGKNVGATDNRHTFGIMPPMASLSRRIS